MVHKAHTIAHQKGEEDGAFAAAKFKRYVRTKINAYRLTSLEEPTDEMLKQIMVEAAQEAKISDEIAFKKFMEQLR